MLSYCQATVSFRSEKCMHHTVCTVSQHYCPFCFCSKLFSIDLNLLTGFLDDDVYLVPEIDGVRIISNEKHEFLQKVPGKLQLLSAYRNCKGIYIFKSLLSENRSYQAITF